jgi:hypothetical protein
MKIAAKLAVALISLYKKYRLKTMEIQSTAEFFFTKTNFSYLVKFFHEKIVQ